MFFILSFFLFIFPALPTTLGRGGGGFKLFIWDESHEWRLQNGACLLRILLDFVSDTIIAFF